MEGLKEKVSFSLSAQKIRRRRFRRSVSNRFVSSIQSIDCSTLSQSDQPALQDYAPTNGASIGIIIVARREGQKLLNDCALSASVYVVRLFEWCCLFAAHPCFQLWIILSIRLYVESRLLSISF